MKYLFLFLLTPSLIMTSCKSTEEETNEINPENNFLIEGNVAGGDNMSYKLEALSQQGTIAVAEAKSDDSGKFRMEGNIPGFGLYQLRIGSANDKIIPLTIVPGDKIKVGGTFSTFESAPIVEGPVWGATMTKYMQVYSEFHTKQNELMLLKGEISDTELADRFIALKKKVDDFAIAEMDKNPSNPFNIILTSSATPTMGFDNWDSKNLDLLKKVSNAYKETYKDSPLSNTLSNQVYQIELAYNQHVANNSGERLAPEISLNNPEGTEIKLSSLKGKYVLIDFWASWCGPCRKESPTVVKMYNKYKNSGFTVYSVSLDDNLEAWKGAIKADGLIWPNHVSDLKKWNSPMPQLYGFNGIPYTVLINPEGKIIGTGLRGESLVQKLKEIFEK